MMRHFLYRIDKAAQGRGTRPFLVCLLIFLAAAGTRAADRPEQERQGVFKVIHHETLFSAAQVRERSPRPQISVPGYLTRIRWESVGRKHEIDLVVSLRLAPRPVVHYFDLREVSARQNFEEEMRNLIQFCRETERFAETLLHLREEAEALLEKQARLTLSNRLVAPSRSALLQCIEKNGSDRGVIRVEIFGDSYSDRWRD